MPDYAPEKPIVPKVHFNKTRGGARTGRVFPSGMRPILCRPILSGQIPGSVDQTDVRKRLREIADQSSGGASIERDESASVRECMDTGHLDHKNGLTIR